jgi:hypothetical protein
VWAGLVLASAATLVVLAVLQYRWISEVREADRERIQIGLETAVGQFLQDYYTELLHVCLEFRSDPRLAGPREWDFYVEHYDDWLRTARRPQLVAGLFLWGAGDDGKPRLMRLNQSSLRLEPAPWPVAMQRLEAGWPIAWRSSVGRARMDFCTDPIRPCLRSSATGWRSPPS